MSPTTGLGDLERSVMDQLWSGGDGHWFTVREVHDALVSDRDIAYTTVMTVLHRLTNKGLVEAQREGRAYLYHAAASREELTAELLRDVLDGAGQDNRRTALVHFVDTAGPEDVAALRQALDHLRA